MQNRREMQYAWLKFDFAVWAVTNFLTTHYNWLPYENLVSIMYHNFALIQIYKNTYYLFRLYSIFFVRCRFIFISFYPSSHETHRHLYFLEAKSQLSAFVLRRHVMTTKENRSSPTNQLIGFSKNQKRQHAYFIQYHAGNTE